MLLNIHVIGGTGFLVRLKHVDNVTSSSNLTEFVWNDQMMNVDIELDTPSLRVQGLVVTCSGCSGPLVVSIDIDSTGTQTVSELHSEDSSAFKSCVNITLIHRILTTVIFNWQPNIQTDSVDRFII